ncbi:MAG: LamG-like jellyroll fold domain-containing protein [Kiritimatiellia bacterium]
MSLILSVSAAESATDKTWMLATEDTELTLSVASNTLRIVRLRNPAQNWNWTPAPSPVPIPGVQGKKVEWTFCEASEIKTNGHEVTLRFTCADPALELKSVWRALPGVGPVENEVRIVNSAEGGVIFDKGMAAARVALAADATVTLQRADKTSHGKGRVYEDVIAPSKTYTTGTGIIPLVIFQAGSKHGFYVGFEWELGGVSVTSQDDPLRLVASVHPLTENVPRGKGEEFLIPSVYYGVYQGDIDDGANRFKRWFWNHKITRSLHDNEDEPWVEVCMQDIGGNGSAGITGKTPQSAYDRLAATGAECAKMDFWDGTGQCWYRNRDWQFQPSVWPDGFDFARKAHKAGLKASLYMGSTYNDANLNTVAGRDAQLEAIRSRYDQGWFDMWRTDKYTAPLEPMPQTYNGVKNFLYIHDWMIANRPGYRYENCCNGGPYKGFAICRRMTFCTMNDLDQDAVATRTTYYSCTYGVNPVQLKSDHGPAGTPYQMRTHMLGAILSWAVDNPVYRQHIALYKSRQRPILRGGNVYHILPMADGTNWDGLQFFNPDLNRGSVFLFKPSAKAADGDAKTIKLKGLDRKASYSLAFQDRTNFNCTATGAQLMDNGIAVSGMTGDLASEIIWINCDVTAAIAADCAVGEQPLPVRFNGGQSVSLSGKIVSYDWDFGDGAKARDVAPIHIYEKTGRYKATLTVLDEQGRRGTALALVTVLPADTIAPELTAVAAPVRSDRVVVTFSEPVQQADVEATVNYAIVPGVKVLAAALDAERRTVTLTTSPLADGEYTLTVKNIRDCARKPNMIGADASKSFRYSPLFARWTLDEGRGLAAADDSGGKFDGVLKGAPVWTNLAGRAGLSFDGVDDIVEMPTRLESLAVPFSFTLWVNPAAEQMEYANILGNHANFNGLVMQQDQNKTNRFYFGYGDGAKGYGSGSVQLIAAAWQHVAVVCDGEKAFCYINGEEKSLGSSIGKFAPNPNLTFRLGQGYGEKRFFRGLLSDVRIYRMALSPAEVQKVLKE